MRDSTFTFRLDKQLKDEFTEAAKGVDRSGAQLLRDFMRDYVKQKQEAVERDATSNKNVKEGQEPSREDDLIHKLIMQKISIDRRTKWHVNE